MRQTQKNIFVHVLYRQFFRIAELLIENGIDVNLLNGDGFAAIHKCARFGSSEMLDLLVKAKANLNILDSRGNTPAKLAEIAGRLEQFKVVLTANAKILLNNSVLDFPGFLLDAVDRGIITNGLHSVFHFHCY